MRRQWRIPHKRGSLCAGILLLLVIGCSHVGPAPTSDHARLDVQWWKYFGARSGILFGFGITEVRLDDTLVVDSKQKRFLVPAGTRRICVRYKYTLLGGERSSYRSGPGMRTVTYGVDRDEGSLCDTLTFAAGKRYKMTMYSYDYIETIESRDGKTEKRKVKRPTLYVKGGGLNYAKPFPGRPMSIRSLH